MSPPRPSERPGGGAATARIYPSLIRPILVGGLEREVMGLVAAVVAALLFAFRFNFVTPALAAIVVFVGVPLLRRATKRDPQVLAVLVDHVRRCGVYVARARHDARRQAPPPTL